MVDPKTYFTPSQEEIQDLRREEYERRLILDGVRRVLAGPKPKIAGRKLDGGCILYEMPKRLWMPPGSN